MKCPLCDKKIKTNKEIVEHISKSHVDEKTNENYNEIEVDLQSGVVKVVSKSETLESCIRKTDSILRKMKGPDIHKYVS